LKNKNQHDCGIMQTYGTPREKNKIKMFAKAIKSLDIS
jgi:hypothetical protein